MSFNVIKNVLKFHFFLYWLIRLIFNVLLLLLMLLLLIGVCCRRRGKFQSKIMQKQVNALDLKLIWSCFNFFLLEVDFYSIMKKEYFKEQYSTEIKTKQRMPNNVTLMKVPVVAFRRIVFVMIERYGINGNDLYSLSILDKYKLVNKNVLFSSS